MDSSGSGRVALKMTKGTLSTDEQQWLIDDWRTSDRRSRTPAWKRWLYRGMRPLLDIEARQHLSAAVLVRWRPEFVFKRRGFPLEARRVFGALGTRLKDATLLVQGTGTGWDVITWAELQPRKIFAIDAFAFDASWESIQRYTKDHLGVPVEFCVAPLTDCAFLPSGSIDLAVSDAVYEHVQDFSPMLDETRRVLRPGGHVYASFGPLWFAPGGDHFSARGTLENVYAHIDRDADAYRSFFKQHAMSIENFQSGGRYVELDMFSKLTCDAYLAEFSNANFTLEALIAEVDPLALAYERAYPEKVQAILARHPGLTRDDLRTKSLLVRLVR